MLFPPLMGIEVVGTRVRSATLVVNAKVSLNLVAQTLVYGCSGLKALPELAGLASLQTLSLEGCSGLSAEDKERAQAVVRANKEREQGR